MHITEIQSIIRDYSSNCKSIKQSTYKKQILKKKKKKKDYLFIGFVSAVRPRMACGILVPWPGIDPAHSAVEAWSLNHWTARELSWTNS